MFNIFTSFEISFTTNKKPVLNVEKILVYWEHFKCIIHLVLNFSRPEANLPNF